MKNSAPRGLEIAGRGAICCPPSPAAQQPARRADPAGDDRGPVRRNRQRRRGGVPQPAVGRRARQPARRRASMRAAARGRCSWTATTARARSRRRCRRCARPSTTARASSLQGNSSAVAAALIDAIDKHNEREPARRVLFLNYSAVDPVLTNEKLQLLALPLRCPCRHAHGGADGGAARGQRALKRVYLIGQDYSFGQAVLREARRQLGAQRPDMQIVGDELHPLGRVKDFAPYASKIKASGAQAVITGNWGNDLTLLVKAAREVGFDGKLLHLLRQRARRAGGHRRRRHRQGAGGGRLAAERADRAQRGLLPVVPRSASRSRPTTTCTCACS